jgi:citrate synthase
MKNLSETENERRALSINDAVSLLGVSRQTLYAYVSRGLVRAEADPDDPRRSLYDPGDIKMLLERKKRGRSRRDVAASTLDWGDPVLPSAITRIVDGTLYFRGKDAVALSRGETLEEVAELLWDSGPLPLVTPAACRPGPGSDGVGQRCIEAAATLMTAGPWSVSPRRALPDASRILRQVAAAAGRSLSPDAEARPIHELLAQSWRKGPHAADLIRRALILCADHELNASTYAARVIASTRASLGAAVLGGLCALSGPLHGGATDLVRSLLSDPRVLQEPEVTLAARVAGGERIPGFGHRLYPAGDPRARELLSALNLTEPWRQVLDAAIRATGTWPNIDFALVLLEKQIDLPREAAFAVFATGRVVGWIAHALEQWSNGHLIRPRAAYVGP